MGLGKLCFHLQNNILPLLKKYSEIFSASSVSLPQEWGTSLTSDTGSELLWGNELLVYMREPKEPAIWVLHFLPQHLPENMIWLAYWFKEAERHWRKPSNLQLKAENISHYSLDQPLLLSQPTISAQMRPTELLKLTQSWVISKWYRSLRYSSLLSLIAVAITT